MQTLVTNFALDPRPARNSRTSLSSIVASVPSVPPGTKMTAGSSGQSLNAIVGRIGMPVSDTTSFVSFHTSRTLYPSSSEKTWCGPTRSRAVNFG